MVSVKILVEVRNDLFNLVGSLLSIMIKYDSEIFKISNINYNFELWIGQV